MSPIATAIFSTQDFIIESASETMLRYWGKTSEVRGKLLASALPELVSQGFFDSVKKVWKSGVTCNVTNKAIELEVNGSPQTCFFDLEYQAVKDERGETYCVLQTAVDVTERTQTRHEIRRMNEQVAILKREQVLHEELSATNDLLSRINEELSSTKNCLEQLNQELDIRVSARTRELAESEARFRFLLDDAPVNIAVLSGRNLIVETANKKILQTWNHRDALGKPLSEVLPELLGQPYLAIMDQVFITGEAFYGNEQMFIIENSGKPQEMFANVIFKPLKNTAGETTGIMLVSHIITDLVNKKKNLEKEQQIATMAIEAAGMGIWHADLKSGMLSGSAQAVRICGFPLNVAFSLEASVEMILPEFRAQVSADLSDAIITGRSFENEYLLKPFDGREPVWIKSNGRASYDATGSPLYLTGAIVDITEQVRFRQEKDALNSALSSTIYDLSAAVTELEKMNQELLSTQIDLQKTVHMLSESESLKEVAIEQSKLGTWYINTLTNNFMPSDRLKEIFGYRTDQQMPADGGTGQIAIDYREIVLGRIANAMQEDKPYDLQYPIIRHNDQQTRWIRATGKIYKSLDMKSAHFSGTVMDMTEQLNAKEELQKAEESLRMATDSAEMGSWLINIATRELICSDRFKRLYGFEATDDLTFDRALQQIPADYRNVVSEAFENSILQSDGKLMFEYPVIAYNNGKLRWVRAIGKVTCDKDGKPARLAGLLHDITEVRQDEIRKNDFIGMVSHELKTPLTSLQGYVQILQERAKNQQDLFASGALNKVNNQINKMTGLINDFLNVSRFESGKIVLNKENFFLDQLVNELIEEAKIMVSSHHLIHSCTYSLPVHADRDKISAVISNLLSNAIKYSPHGKTIAINCQVTDTKVLISVKDEGIGVCKSDSVKLFERYYRVENKLSNTISGFGIGLYLSAEIIEWHAGSIWVESVPGEGSTFFFSLPIGSYILN